VANGTSMRIAEGVACWRYHAGFSGFHCWYGV